MDNLFFTSDHHFSHRNIIKYTRRPWEYSQDGVQRMDEDLILNWNNTVPTNGIVYHLGDIFLCDQQRARKIRERLNGQIYFIKGNHDKTACSLPHLFGWIKDYFDLRVDDPNAPRGTQNVVMLHYAMKVWNKSHHGAFSLYSDMVGQPEAPEDDDEIYALYGHSHGSLPDDLNARSIDVGVDAIAHRLAGDVDGKKPETWQREDYRPISYRELRQIMAEKIWKPVDHHKDE